MVKTIQINGKNYNMSASAYTQFAYKNMTGRSFLDDLQKLTERKDGDLSKLDEFIETILDVAYVMVNENDPKSYPTEKDFITSIDSLFDDTHWIEEVIAFATTPLSGKIQNHQ